MLTRGAVVGIVVLLVVSAPLGIVALGPPGSTVETTNVRTTGSETCGVEATVNGSVTDRRTRDETIPTLPDTRVVDETVTIATPHDLEVDTDSAGTPHVVYQNDSRIAYAWRNRTGWWIDHVPRRLVHPADPNLPVDPIEMALDDSGRPHVLFMQLPGDASESDENHTLVHAYREGGTWASEVIVSERDGNWDLSNQAYSIAVGPEGTLRIAYALRREDAIAATIRYAEKVDGEWRREVADTQAADEIIYPGGTDVDELSMAIDDGGRPHLAYSTDRDRKKISYTHRNGSGRWNESVVDPNTKTGPINRAIGIAADSGGDPHIAYTTAHNATRWITHATLDRGSWHRERVGRATQQGSVQPSIGIDSRGRPHLLYSRELGPFDPSEPTYAIRSNGSWTVKVVRRGVDAFTSRLALDGNGHPHVAYVPRIEGEDRLLYTTGRTIPIASSVKLPFFDLRNTQPPSIEPDGGARGSLELANVGTREGIALVAVAHPKSVSLSFSEENNVNVTLKKPGFAVLRVRLDTFEREIQPYTIGLEREAVFGENASHDIGDLVTVNADLAAVVTVERWEAIKRNHTTAANRTAVASLVGTRHYDECIDALAALDSEDFRASIDRLARTNERLASFLSDRACVERTLRNATRPPVCEGGQP